LFEFPGILKPTKKAAHRQRNGRSQKNCLNERRSSIQKGDEKTVPVKSERQSTFMEAVDP
jgi:hypothetical protein